MMKVRCALLSMSLFATVGCSKPPPVCDAGARYYEALKMCVPACETVFGYESCYGRDGELYTDGSYDGPRGDGGSESSVGIDANATDAEASTPSCDAGQSVCTGRCIVTQSDPLNCGACGRTCSAGSGATAICQMGSCSSVCRAGFEQVGDTCEPVIPRPLFPSVTSTVTTRRPTLRWTAPAGVTGAQVELCRDRACNTVIERIDADGTNVRPSSDLPANRVVFWRLRGKVDVTTGARLSPTWQFRTGVLSAAVDTAHGVEADFNGDGFSDLAIGDASANSGQGAVSVYYGSVTGLGATPGRVLTGPMGGGFGRVVASGGDINGDGFTDLLIAAPDLAVGGRFNAGSVFVHFGDPTGIAPTPSQTITGSAPGRDFGAVVVGLGDVNRDGWSDVAVGYIAGTVPSTIQQVHVLLGSATGLASTPTQSFEGRITAGEFTVGVAAVGDTNADGYSDLVLTNLVDSTTRVYRGSASGLSNTAHVTIPRATRSASGCGDVNGDGFADFVLPSGGGAVVYWGSSTGPALVESQTIGGAATIVLWEHAGMGGDFNGDGFADLLVPIDQAGQPRIGLFLGGATGLSSSARSTMGAVDHAGALRMRGDFNGDGLADATLTSSSLSMTPAPASVWFGTNRTPAAPTDLVFGQSATP